MSQPDPAHLLPRPPSRAARAARAVAIAVACVAVAAALRVAMTPFVAHRAPFMTFFPAVIAATLWGRLWAGVLTAALSSVVAVLFLQPVGTWRIEGAHDLPALLFFAATAAVLVAFAEWSSRARDREAAGERLRALIADAIPAQIAFVGTDGRFRWVNAEYGRRFAVPAADLVGRPMRDVLGGQYAVSEPYVARALAGERVTFERRIVYPAVGPRDVEVTYTPHLDPDGRPRGFAVLVVDVTDRRATAERIGGLNDELRQRVAQLEALMTVLPVGIAVAHDPRCERVSIDPAFARLLGVPPQANISMSGPAADRVPYRYLRDGAEVPPADLPLERACAGRPTPAQELEVRRADGSSAWLMVSAASVLDEAGSPAGAIAAHVDVTELHQARARAAESELRFRTMADAAPVLVWIADPAGRRVWFNRPWLEFVGRGTEREAGDGWADHVHPGDRDRYLSAYRAAFAAREPFAIEYRLRRHDGQYRWVLAKAVTLAAAGGAFAGFVGTCTDITEMRAARDALAASEARFRRSVEEAPVPIMIHAEDGRILAVSRAFTELTGYGLADVPTTAAWAAAAYGPAADVMVGTIDRLCRDQAAARDRWEFDVQTRWGTTRRWSFSTAPLGPAADGRLVQVTTAVDLTERRELERHREFALHSERSARAEAERAGRMKDEFLATLSHELRTPLNAILGWAQLLHRPAAAADPESLREGLDAILRNARAQTQLIADLLDMSRIVSGKLRLELSAVDPTAVAEAAIASVRPSAELKGVRVERALDPLAGPVRGDAGRLQQVAWNLLTNAVKFTPAGGVVRVEVRRVGPAVELAVSDTGQGIDPDFLPHVFERFRQADASTTRRHGGLGLGLSIARQIVEMHAGSIRADSDGTGRGATFTVTLPRDVAGSTAAGDGGAAAGDPAAADQALAGLRVLVVDDDPDAREVARRVVEGHGGTAAVAASVAEAIDAVRATRPDVVLSDIGMPGEDGYDLVRRLRALPADEGGLTPAAAMTAFARAEDRERAILSGFQAHVPKPVEPPDLVATVARLARAGRNAAAAP